MLRAIMLMTLAFLIAGCGDKSAAKSSAIVTVSSQQDNEALGPQGLLSDTPPGWHSQSTPVYPQFIMVDFGSAIEMHSIRLMPQEDQPTRGPKAVNIEVSEDGKDWQNVGGTSDACKLNATDGTFNIDLSNKVTNRYLRLRILSNCGAPDLLTLQGLSIS